MSTPTQTTPAPENAQPTPGLFTFHDFIRPGEQSIYTELDESLRHDLAPVGFLENTLVDEIRRAMWRLRRCGIVEENLAAENAADPMQHENQRKIQLTVDRSRTQAHRLLHKCTAELRRLQTDRTYRNETFPAGTDISSHGLTDWRYVQKGTDQQVCADYRRHKIMEMLEVDVLLSTPIRAPGAPGTPRAAGSSCKTPAAA